MQHTLVLSKSVEGLLSTRPLHLALIRCCEACMQYNPYGDLKSLAPDDDRLLNSSNGSLIAVNYVARGAGVKRNMRGDEARKLCPELQLVQVPTAHGKADLTLYRDAGARVVDILARKATCERASSEQWKKGRTLVVRVVVVDGGGDLVK